MRKALTATVAALLSVGLPLYGTATASAQRPGKKHFTYEQAFGSVGRPQPPGAGDSILGQLPTVTGWADDER
ncbi:MAG TPA: hypothetical protein VNO70_16600, partial [Blastocatellia bacterium]|nr:hypothetical protein [Blastocatellia bacterium]